MENRLTKKCQFKDVDVTNCFATLYGTIYFKTDSRVHVDNCIKKPIKSNERIIVSRISSHIQQVWELTPEALFKLSLLPEQTIQQIKVEIASDLNEPYPNGYEKFSALSYGDFFKCLNKCTIYMKIKPVTIGNTTINAMDSDGNPKFIDDTYPVKIEYASFKE